MGSLATPNVAVHGPGSSLGEGWDLSEETMPESVLHDQAVELLKALLAAWAAKVGAMQVVRNLAVRWDEARPTIGVNPDVAVLSPPPPTDGGDLRSVRTWVEGHSAPLLGIEVVSENHPRKDYVIAPDKYAASGTRELWIFDPLLCGPAVHGGPYRLQIWHRRDGGWARIFAGEGPAYSPTLRAYAVAVDEGRKLRIADDAQATRFWLTAEEAERAAKDAERLAKESALARIAELETLLEKARAGR
ncbi:Uma2 family endonuclease [Pendulispora albinea]|uniref:Uma2 family endonuclease n=1 Tax=Pendulispora albinea TaxID=2741071 RepID=A0ABZ2LUP8_9BACT